MRDGSQRGVSANNACEPADAGALMASRLALLRLVAGERAVALGTGMGPLPVWRVIVASDHPRGGGHVTHVLCIVYGLETDSIPPLADGIAGMYLKEWRRRYFRLFGNQLHFMKSEEVRVFAANSPWCGAVVQQIVSLSFIVLTCGFCHCSMIRMARLICASA